MGQFGSFREFERVSRRRTLALVAKLILVLAALGLGFDFIFHNLRFRDGRLFGFPWFAATAILFGSVRALRANFSGADLVMRAMGARPIVTDDPKNSVVINVVREMALAARIPAPRIEVIDDPSPNAFAIGRDPAHSAICVTQGLLDQMDREELQGVIAHEMAHIRNCDIRLTTMVTVMLSGFGVLASRIASMLLVREREYLADASAVEFTRNPTALLRALEQIARTESPLRCATRGTAQLFIVDPFQRADSGRSYEQFINEITRIRLQSAKTQEQRDAEARSFVEHEYPRNFEAISSHPPLRDRIARLQALAGTTPARPATELTADQLRANWSESVKFVTHLATTDPEVMANAMQSVLLATETGRSLLQQKIGGIQIRVKTTTRDGIEEKVYDSNLASEDLKLEQSSGTEIGAQDSIAQTELGREALVKILGTVTASMHPPKAVTLPAAAQRPSGSRGMLLFWLVIAVSAGTVVAALAIR